MRKSFQRIGAKSNAQVGREFELRAQSFFSVQGIHLKPNHRIAIGIGNHEKKPHAFDLGCNEQKVIVECKSHCWTSGNNVPSAKMTVWNEAMYYFHAAPHDYRKIMFVLRHCNSDNESLASNYLRTYKHLVPNNVEFWEYDEQQHTANQIYPQR